MLTGSLAMSYYATPRMTRDIDLVVELSVGDVARLRDALGEAYHVPDDVATSIAAPGMFNVVHVPSLVKVDLVVRKATAYREREFARRGRVRFGDFDVTIVSKEDLIVSKLGDESGLDSLDSDVDANVEGDVDVDVESSEN